MSFPDRDVQILMFAHDYGSMDKERIWQTALTRALDLPEPALPAGMNGRDAAVLWSTGCSAGRRTGARWRRFPMICFWTCRARTRDMKTCWRRF